MCAIVARQATALTFGMITMVDDAVGRVLKQLDELGLSDDTVVIFTSDHGDYMGDHQLMLKGPIRKGPSAGPEYSRKSNSSFIPGSSSRS